MGRGLHEKGHFFIDSKILGHLLPVSPIPTSLNKGNILTISLERCLNVDIWDVFIMSFKQLSEVPSSAIIFLRILTVFIVALNALVISILSRLLNAFYFQK